MFRSKMLVCALMLAAGLLISSGSYAKGDPAPEEMTGLKIGDTVPDFTLKDQNGKEHTLAGLLDKKGTTVLVFHRSANW